MSTRGIVDGVRDRLRHVGAGVDTALGILGKSHLEALLDLLEHPLVLLAADERDRKTLCTETTGTANAVQVRVRIRRQVVVDGKVDTFDIDTTSEDVGGDTDTLVELLELLVAFDTAEC